jgi:hypothetical protein
MRDAAIVDSTQFTAEELIWLEVGASTGEFNDENFMVESQPIDPLTQSKMIDIRKRPECD